MIKMVVCEQKFMNWSETCKKWFLSEGLCGTVLKMGSRQGNLGINDQLTLTFASHEICWDQKGHVIMLPLIRPTCLFLIYGVSKNVLYRVSEKY